MQKVVAAIIIALVLIITNPNNTKAFGLILINSPSDTNSSSDTNTTQEIYYNNEQINEKLENGGIKEDNISGQFYGDEGEDFNEVYLALKPLDYRFILDKSDWCPILEREIEEQVYFWKEGQECNLSEGILELLKNGFIQQKEGSNIDELEDAFENSFYTYMEQENSFKEQMNEAFIEKYLIIWEQKAPHSSELESYIKGREELNLIETGEGCGNYKIWWTLANDYQFYAMEYERQTQNQQAIFYYYTKSIYCCMEALKYSMPDEEAEIIYNYMLIRYKDISRIEVCVPEKYKIRARDILDKFKELSNVQW